MNSICLKKLSKQSSTSQEARVTAIADTGTTAAAGAAITAATAAALAEEDIMIVMAAVTATNAVATAAVNSKKFLFRIGTRVFLCH